MSLLSILFADKIRRKRIAGASAQLPSLLGGSVTTEGSMMGSETFDQMGNPVFDQPTLQQPRREGYGFLGSDRGYGDKLELAGGMIGAGYNPSETNTMLGQLPQAPRPSNLQQQFEYYQSLQPTEQEELLDYKRAGAQNINLNQGMPGRVLTNEEKLQNSLPPEATYQYDKNGMIKAVSKEQFSQPQIESGGYATRMTSSEEIINGILSDGEFEPGGIVQNIEEFGIPSMMANFMRSAEGQRYRQAQDNWLSANLRKESGAVLGKDEIESERRKWFPVIGDKPENIKQKREARKDAERSMIKASGGSYESLEDQADQEELEDLRKLQGDL